MTAGTLNGSAAVQEHLWSQRADDWAQHQEGQMRSAFETALDAVGVTSGTHLLDAGCGAGLVLRLAADRGADVSGLDATAALLGHARERVPAAPVAHGELESLPYPDDAFDVVTGFNSFQYATRPAVAVREAARVTRAGGKVLVLVWGPPETCEAGPYLAALGALMPPPPPGAPGPYALSGEQALEALLAGAGLDPVTIADVPAPWVYPDEAVAVRGLLSSGPAVKAIEHSGEAAARDAVLAAIEPYRTENGGYRLENTFRFAIGTNGR
jgi:SAM-dependent methyltransferase